MPEPSRWLRQHHGLEAPAIDFGAWRPYWRIRTRLDRLLHDGAITPHEWAAAVRLRRTLETAQAAMLPTLRLDGPHRRHGGSSGPAQPRRADAMARLEEVRAGLGSFALGLLEACLFGDCTWAWLGQRLGIDPKTARAWTITAIRALVTLNPTSGRPPRIG